MNGIFFFFLSLSHVEFLGVRVLGYYHHSNKLRDLHIFGDCLPQYFPQWALCPAKGNLLVIPGPKATQLFSTRAKAI